MKVFVRVQAAKQLAALGGDTRRSEKQLQQAVISMPDEILYGPTAVSFTAR
jgi:hypothetical protein